MSQSSPERTGGDVLVESLIAHGVDTVFGLPGVQLDGAFNALHRVQDTISVIHPRHEQTTAYMADGYARVSGKMGVNLVVPGPGVLNATAAISTAYACASPVLTISGQMSRDSIGAGIGNLHEIRDQTGMLRHITKFAECALEPSDISPTINRAVQALWDGYVRPVLVEVPIDTLHESTSAAIEAPAPQRALVEPDEEQLSAVVKAIQAAKNPMIITGGAINNSGAYDELVALAELIQAPVMGIHNGKGAISDRHYLAQNSLGGRHLMASADLILLIGTRLSESNQFPWTIEKDHRYVQIDIDPDAIGHNVPVVAGMVADTKPALIALMNQLTAKPSRKVELEEIKRRSDEALDRIQPHAQWGRAVRKALPDDAIVLNDMTQISYWGNLGWPTYQPKTFLTSGYQGTLGWAYPTSLGAKIAAGDRVVVSINGDGGFGFCLNELATQAQHGIAAISLVFNDSGFGNVRRMQRDLYDGSEIASHLSNPDYVKLADSFGITGRRAESPESLITHLTEAIQANEPTLIEIPVDPMPSAWSNLHLD